MPRSSMGFAALGALSRDEGRMVPQQLGGGCHTDYGPCTHQWPFFSPQQAFGHTPGAVQTCTSAFQYPWITECQNPDGSYYVQNQGCGFCV